MSFQYSNLILTCYKSLHLFRRILASQLAISDEDRQRILDEHEKQQVALESSLAFSKLRQRRLLEEKLAEKRAKQMEKLQKRQQQEVKVPVFHSSLLHAHRSPLLVKVQPVY